MNRKLLLIALFAISSSSFAMNEKKEVNLFKAELPPTTLCERSEATDRDGNVIASGECCRSYQTAPKPNEEVGIRLKLKVCADAALENNIKNME